MKLMSYSVPFHAQIHPQPEKKKDSQATNQVSGLKPCGASSLVDQRLWLSNSLKGLSIEDYEQLLPDSIWLDIKQRLRSSARRSSVRLTRGKECLSLPTVTTLPLSRGKGGSAGQNNLEITLKSQNRLSPTQKLNPELCAYLMGFPSGWTQLLMTTGGNLTNHPQSQGLHHVHPDVGNA